MGAEHQQSFQKAVAIIFAAKKAGADAVKVQMFKPENMTTKDYYIKEGQWEGMNLYDLYEKACMPYDWLAKLKVQAESIGIKFFTSVYDPQTVEFTESVGIERYKISSFEANYQDLLDAVEKTGKPVIISTGSATYKEIENIVKIFGDRLTLLCCVSQYPAPIDKMNLRTITAYEHVFKVKTGLSDHTKGIVAPVVAVALGARVIEKHITIDSKGLDSSFAILPDKFYTMTQTIRAAQKSIGEITYGGKKTFHRKLVDGKWVRTC